MLPLLLAAEVAEQSVTQWVVGVVATGVVTTLGLLVRHAVASLTSSVEANTKALESTKTELLVKMDALRDQVARGDGDRRVLEERLQALVHRVDQFEERLREASEGLVR